MPENESLIQLTGDIVAAHVSNNSVTVGDMPTLIQKVHEALSSLGTSAEQPQESKTPAVSVKASVKPDYLVCLVCSKKQKTLKRHLKTAHGLTPDEYRSEYGLSASYPMTAPAYSERRREMAKTIGLGRKPGSRRRKGKANKKA